MDYSFLSVEPAFVTRLRRRLPPPAERPVEDADVMLARSVAQTTDWTNVSWQTHMETQRLLSDPWVSLRRGAVREQWEATPKTEPSASPLPISDFEAPLTELLRGTQVLVVMGATGSGKSTQMPQFLWKAGFAKTGLIGVTQPRRIAAMTLASRVSSELHTRLGDLVGYKIRFEDKTTRDTRIKFMTDGILLRESVTDSSLAAYDCVILDEAHERTLNTDVLFGILKRTLRRRPEFRVVVMSATLDAQKFSKFFFDAPVVEIPGRMHPVDISYESEPVTDFITAALAKVVTLHLTEPPGDILVFFTGQDDIDGACTVLEKVSCLLGDSAEPMTVLPVYSNLPAEEQKRIFDPPAPGSRKVVLATNIAETSITLDGVVFVVDGGFAKINTFDARTRMNTLAVAAISQANAAQRAGRAGRTRPGKCHRLYTEPVFKALQPNAVPEIRRMNLANVVLLLKSLGVNDVASFEFIDTPDSSALLAALRSLHELRALCDRGNITASGRKLARFPLEPILADMLVTSASRGCSSEMVTIIAMLQLDKVFVSPRGSEESAAEARRSFHHEMGDHITLFQVFESWRKAKSRRQANPWAYNNYLHCQSLWKADNIRRQLVQTMRGIRVPLASCGQNWEPLQKSLCAGFIRNAAKLIYTQGTTFKTMTDGVEAMIHPKSALAKSPPAWVVFTELIQTRKRFIQNCTTIQPEWLVELAPHLIEATPLPADGWGPQESWDNTGDEEW